MTTRNFSSHKGPSRNLGSWDDITDAPFSERARPNEAAFCRNRKSGSPHAAAGSEQQKTADPRATKPVEPTILQTIAGLLVIGILGIALFGILKLVLAVLGPFMAVLVLAALGFRAFNSPR